MACKDAVAHTDTWLVSISVPLNQCHTAPVSRMHAVPALFGMYVLLLCTCEIHTIHTLQAQHACEKRVLCHTVCCADLRWLAARTKFQGFIPKP